MRSKPILVVDDSLEIRTTLFEALTRCGHAVALAEDGREAAEMFRAGSFELVITELSLPGKNGLDLLQEFKAASPQTEVIIVSGGGSVDNAVEAMRLGAFDFIVKPFTEDVICETVSRAAGLVNKETEACKAARKGSNGKVRTIITKDPGMARLLEMAASVAPSKATVLIQGQSGTGKELLARHIHQSSDRASGPFVAINCASLPEGLLESELFGHEKGSFTGASMRKIGKFELAHNGSILLDEISEMDLSLQAKLLRVLQEGEVDRVGGKEPVPIDVRVIATTNRDLFAWVKEGNFRQDLYYRVNVIPLRIPALKDRIGDIPKLAEHFLIKYSMDCGKEIKNLSKEALACLTKMEWPGNIREFENIIARGVLLSGGRTINVNDLFIDEPIPEFDPTDSPASDAEGSGGLMTIREMERKLINHALTQTEGNRTHAAKILGISVRTLRNKLAEYKNLNWEAGQAAC